MDGVTGATWSVVLTGSADSLSDLTLNCKNLSASLRDSTASFMSFVVDYDQLDDITSRPNGDIELYRTLQPDGSASLVYSVNFNDYRIDRGGRNRSVSISGRSSAAFAAPAFVDLVDVLSDNLLSDGRRQLIVNPANDVVPGYTAIYDSVSTVIESVDITAGSSGSRMTLTEAA